MEGFFSQALGQLLERPTGPFHMRFVLQPFVASVIAVRAGLRDASRREPPYFWSVVFEPSRRRSCLKSGWQDVGRVFLVALMLDGGYQLYVFGALHPLQALIVATVLAIVPYLALRGPTTRIAGFWYRSRAAPARR